MNIDEQLNKLIELLETLPKRLSDEMENRDALMRAENLKRIQADIEFHNENIKQINEMIFGQYNPKYVIEPDKPEDELVAKQMTSLLNYSINRELSGGN